MRGTRLIPAAAFYTGPKRSVLERDELIRSHWEKQSIADAEQRPPRKYYTLTASGRATLDAAEKRYPLLAKLMSAGVGKEE